MKSPPPSRQPGCSRDSLLHRAPMYRKPETLRSKGRNLKHVPFWSGLEINSSAGQHGAVPRTCTNSKKSLLHRTCEGGQGNRLQCVLNCMTWATLLPLKNGWTTGFQAQCSWEGRCCLQKLTFTMKAEKRHTQRMSKGAATGSVWRATPRHGRSEAHCLGLAQAPPAQRSVTGVILWKSHELQKDTLHHVWVQLPPHMWLWPLGDVTN